MHHPNRTDGIFTMIEKSIIKQNVNQLDIDNNMVQMANECVASIVGFIAVI